MTGSISMRHSDRAANDIHEGGIVQSAPLSLQHTAVHNNYHIPTPDQPSVLILEHEMKLAILKGAHTSPPESLILHIANHL